VYCIDASLVYLCIGVIGIGVLEYCIVVLVYCINAISVLVYWCIGVLLHWCIGVLESFVLVYWCIGVLVYCIDAISACVYYYWCIIVLVYEYCCIDVLY
jgi:hypothetical protein